MNKRIRKSGWLGMLCAPLAVLGLGALISCGGGSGQINVTSIDITPTTATVALNTQLQFNATVNLANTTSTSTTNTAVTWYVNGVAGGNSQVGTIVPSTLSVQVGVYTAPAATPSTNNGVVNITAEAPQFPGTTTNTTTITSNTAAITIGVGAGLQISPTAATVPAGGTFQFNSTLNSVTTTAANYAISSANGGNIGTIDPNTGLYTAPLYPPPGGQITVTATSGTQSSSATAQITYSDASLTGPFAFSYIGNNALGYYAVAGSFVADGNGNITSGLSDANGFLGGPSGAVAFTGTYQVAPDGRGSAVITGGPGGGTSSSWAFVLTTNQHGYLTRFNAQFTGTGGLDQQNLNDLTTSPSVMSGPYVFQFTGSDATFQQLAAAGRYTANGAGQIPNSATVVDYNDNGTVTANDNTLQGSYSFDVTQPNTGRGTMTLTSTSIGTLHFAFYTVDNTHFRAVETDTTDYLAGDIFSGLAAPYGPGNLVSGNYAFTVGGTSSAGGYALGGVITSSGTGTISAGESDLNNAGTTTLATKLGSCNYTSNTTNSRIDLTIGASGCATEFAAYPTSAGSVLLLELDSAAVAGGVAYQQAASPAIPSGSIAIGLGAQGIFYSSPSSYGQDLDASVNFLTTVGNVGFIDINNYNAVYPNDPVNTTTSTSTTPTQIGTPDSFGRGTATLSGQNPNVAFGLVYYVVNPNLSLLLGSDKTRTNTGLLGLQF
ncbi:MAG: hypothetical protein ABSC71_15460 [Candidatus Acidiferrales bacterium]